VKKSYIFIFNNELGTKEEVKNFLNTCDQVSTWRNELPNTYFIVSELSAYRLYDLVANHFGEKKGAYLLTEYVQENSQGLLNKRSWHLLNEKKLPPKEQN
jgi:hypothetical protein